MAEQHDALHIRQGTVDDCALLLSLIKELAEYEKLADKVVATEAELRESLFGPRASAEVLIGEYHKTPVAYALFFHNFSTFMGRPGIYLEDIYVQPAVRGKGFGKALMQHIAALAVERNCTRMEWSVLDWNEPSIQFYRSIGAVPMSGWTVQRLSGDALESLAAAAGTGNE